MEELIEQMKQELRAFILVDKETGASFDMLEIHITEHLLEKYIEKAWNHDTSK